MNRTLKKFAGAIPFASVVLCSLVVAMIEGITGDTFRSTPRIILMCLGLCSFGIFLFWLNTRKKIIELKPIFLTWAIRFVSILLFFFVALIDIFIIGFFSNPEHIVTINNTKMVASVSSFLDVYVDYYQYKNILFYGKELGHEYYGSGGYDPFEESEKPDPVYSTFYDSAGNTNSDESDDDSADVYYESNSEITSDSSQNELNQEAPIKELDIGILENRTDELVFDFSIDDFIDSYNGYYWQDNHARYLSSANNWPGVIYETAIHSNHETICYNFSEDRKIWPLPTITVYVPTNADYVQEVTLNFDDHSYTEAMYDLYEEICFYSLKVFFPDMENEKITELYQTLNHLAYENIMPHEKGYSSDSIPCALYYKDGIGLYPYFAIGESVHLCIIPVTEEIISYYERNGVEVHEIN